MSRIKAIIFAVLTLLIICFIWGQSTLPRGASAAESSRLMQLFKPLLDPNDRIDDSVFHHYLRKAAHFLEYAALGFFMSGFLLSLRWKKRSWSIPAVILCSFLIAAIDETIQLFSDSRGPQIRDVLLDFSGAVFGLLAFLVLTKIISSLIQHSQKMKAANRFDSRLCLYGIMRLHCRDAYTRRSASCDR